MVVLQVLRRNNSRPESKTAPQGRWFREVRAGSHQVGRLTAGRLVLVVTDAVLVAAHLPVQLVDQLVDRGVQILVGLLHENIPALHVESDFCLLASGLFLQALLFSFSF